MTTLIIFVGLGVLIYLYQAKKRKNREETETAEAVLSQQEELLPSVGKKTVNVGYHKQIRAVMKYYGEGKVSGTDAYDEMFRLAKQPEIQEKLYTEFDGQCHFSETEMPLDSYPLMVCGEQKVIYSYYRVDGKWGHDYSDRYDGDRNKDLVITSENLYIVPDMSKKNNIGKLVEKIPLTKIKDVVESAEYCEIYLATPLAGVRIRNFWAVGGNSTLYSVLCCCLAKRGPGKLHPVAGKITK